MIKLEIASKKLVWIAVAILLVMLTACGAPSSAKSDASESSKSAVSSAVVSTVASAISSSNAESSKPSASPTGASTVTSTMASNAAGNSKPAIILDEIIEPPDNPIIVLTAEDADLTLSKNVILEPDDPPYNLGGWIGEGMVTWQEVEIPATGIYYVGVYYSRDYTDKDIWGTINLHPLASQDISDDEQLVFPVKPTSVDIGDWSVYSYKETLFVYLYAGSYLVELYPGSDGYPMPDNEYFLNLKSIMFVTSAAARGEIDDSASTTLAAIKAPPDHPHKVLLAEKAVLSAQNAAVLESGTPSVLRKWTGEGTAVWQDIWLSFDSVYNIGVYYSRAYTDKEIWGTIKISPKDSSEETLFEFRVNPTSSDGDDWSVYTYKDEMLVELEAGYYTVEISPGTNDHPMPDDEYFLDLKRIMFVRDEDTGFARDSDDVKLFSYVEDYSSLTQEQRLEMLSYDSMDVGNPWKPYTAEVVFGFLTWYANDQYGLNLTVEDVENAVGEVSKAEPYDGVGEHPLASLSRFYHVCVYYKLYPTQEMRENEIYCFHGFMPFGEEPLRAKGDTDSISEDYFKIIYT